MAALPKLAVWKFASCDGCQLSLLDCEDELLAVAGSVEIANFTEASTTVVEGPYDVSLVEGSVTTPHDAERIQEVRQSSRFLVAIGACATAGGHPGAAQLHRGRRAGVGRVRPPRVPLHPGELDPHLRPRPGGLRAARAARWTAASCSRC